MLQQAQDWLQLHAELDPNESSRTTITRVFYERFVGNSRNSNPMAYPPVIDVTTIAGDLFRQFHGQRPMGPLYRALKAFYKRPPIPLFVKKAA